jgi:hypothetical protein
MMGLPGPVTCSTVSRLDLAGLYTDDPIFGLIRRGSQTRLLAWSPASPVGKQEKPLPGIAQFNQKRVDR